MSQKVLILDFGSQVTQLIARRVRELNIYCEIVPFHATIDWQSEDIKAVILSGSPASVRQDKAPSVDLQKIASQCPVLGICYGAQLIAAQLGGEVSPSKHREYGNANLKQLGSDPLWEGIPNESQIWMSHSDTITQLPKDYLCIGATDDIPIAAFKSTHTQHPIYAVQFHPEVVHSPYGTQILGNFLIGICQLEASWTPFSFVEHTVGDIQKQIGDDEVLLALSGGVDSSVAALLMHKAIGNKLRCFFIDNGLLRKNEFQEVLDAYAHIGLDVKGIDAKKYFLNALSGISDPELKRKAIGKAFIDVFEQAAKEFPNVKWLCQGTIYPDVIESVSVFGPSVTIKSHHNVGGLPKNLALKIIEPLKLLFKDEVRRVGNTLGLPSIILNRHPFPGPGLAIRILSEITEEKIEILQEADAIYIHLLKEFGWYDQIWQAGAILLPVKTVGVMGDERTYEYVLALRAVSSLDGMTASWSEIPHSLLAKISSEIINKVKGINRVVYDISSKPPATIEWE